LSTFVRDSRIVSSTTRNDVHLVEIAAVGIGVARSFFA
jgi:hypothetical protein